MVKLSTEENTCLYYTKYICFRTIVDCHNIQALIHGLFLHCFLYSFTNPSFDFVCRSAAVWIYQVGYLLLPNCFFSLCSHLIVNTLLSYKYCLFVKKTYVPDYTKPGNNVTAIRT